MKKYFSLAVLAVVMLAVFLFPGGSLSWDRGVDYIVRDKGGWSGIHSPPANNTIYVEEIHDYDAYRAISLTSYTNTTTAADAYINLEEESNGKIGNGVKAVLIKAYGKDSAAGDGIGFSVRTASSGVNGVTVNTQVNNVNNYGIGWVPVSNGKIYFDHTGSGASALTVNIKVLGIQTN